MPNFRQKDDYCGPTALASLLSWAGKPTQPNGLAKLVFLPGRSGTLALDIVREIRAQGLLAYEIHPSVTALLQEIGAGFPALVLENRGLASYPVWHYSVVTGYDLHTETVDLAEGAALARTASLSTFAQTWKRGGYFAVLALPAGTLPHADDPDGIFVAIAELEDIGSTPETASLTYQAFVNRWPDDWRGPFGLANVSHNLGDFEMARQLLHEAQALAPDRPEPANNLALLNLEEGQKEQAAHLAKQAVENAVLLGLNPKPYQDTLLQALAATDVDVEETGNNPHSHSFP